MSNPIVVKATYENGVLHLTQPLDLAEQQVVQISLHPDFAISDHPYVSQTPGICGGRPVIEGTRIPVKTLVRYYRMRYTVTEILEGFPDLTAAQLHDALSYYYDHQAEMDADMEADELPAIQAQFNLKMDSDGLLQPAS